CSPVVATARRRLFPTTLSIWLRFTRTRRIRMKNASSRRGPSSRARSFRPHVEALELRLVPAMLPLPQPDHVVIVIAENHGFSEVTGQPSIAPYITQTLVPQAALFTQSFAITHPSQPNYLHLFSGDNQGVVDSTIPSQPFITANLGASLIAAGRSFKGYSE